MLISHRHRFVFIHIQKTGGDTISRLLSERVPDLQRLGAKHERLCDRATLLEDHADYLKFAFVRNPWDRLVSWYSMISAAAMVTEDEARQSARSRIRYEQVRSNPLWRYVLESSTDFSTFLTNCTAPIEIRPGVCYSFTYNQLDYLTDASGVMRADFVGRFENLTGDLDAVLDRLQVPRGDALYHENASRHAHYADYYTVQTRAIVQQRFQADIDRFGYRFEAGPAAPPAGDDAEA